MKSEVSRQEEWKRLSRSVRAQVLRMTHRAKSSHVGTCFSIVELLVVLYHRILRIDPATPLWPGRDRFILSKGHGAAALYAVLAGRGFFPEQWLETFYGDGAQLAGHVTHRGIPGVELSTGSLGHGLPVGCGMALAAKRDEAASRVFALLSDGECDEGSTWEAALFAPHHKLDNLTAIVDYNKIQSLGTVKSVLDLDPLPEKWRAFGWAVREIDGHDCVQIEEVLRNAPCEPGRPTCVIAHTVKGKGVSFMEDKLLWHYRSPDADEMQRAMAELGVSE
ncbi:MAG: transketolase [Candidatus Acidiferrales bacterium]